MEENKHFTDKELQEVIDGIYTGNLDLFHAHLRVCITCQHQFESYQRAVNLLGNEHLQFSQTTQAIDEAWSKVQQKRRTVVVEALQFWFVVITCSAVVILCLGYLAAIGISLTMLTVIISFIGAYLFLAFKEMRLLAGNP
jgi:hypothetical protein